ncbi:Nucleoporin Nup43 [Lamellibrachia satsuma]|nr:Nucleoporin Nup43 [Lamellibrachia satsuma]
MAEETTCVAKFVSQKISKIRWQPTPKHVIQQSNIFATGSWDNDKNHLSVWQLERSTLPDDSMAGDKDAGFVPEWEPTLLNELEHAGDITDLVFLTTELLLVASSTGTVQVCRYQSTTQRLIISWVWQGLHHNMRGACACTGLATRMDDTFTTIGEDGRMNIMCVEHRQPVREINNADSCTLNSACFLKQSEVATVNSTGQLKVWDLRQQGDEPAKVFQPTGDRVSLHCVDKHPTQQHIVATGGQDGTLCTWDMRQDRFPVSLLSAHTADMWEVKFHPSHPNSLFTCSEDGSVWHWDGSSINSTPLTTVSASNKDISTRLGDTTRLGDMSRWGTNLSVTEDTSVWLASEAMKHRVETTDLLAGNLMPVNSIDIVNDTLLCGTDSEQIYTLRNLLIQ